VRAARRARSRSPATIRGKFPSPRQHVIYFKGASLGEAWFRSATYVPFQHLFVGDPLTRPYADFPAVDLPAPPSGPVMGVVGLVPSATATAAGAAIAQLELLVDGRLVESIAAGAAFALDTTVLADGWHELRVLAHDDTPERNSGRWIGALEVDNAGRSVDLSAAGASGDLSTPFALTTSAAGATVREVRLVHNGRVVAATSSADDTLLVHGQVLGAGPAQLQAEALFDDGKSALSAPVDLAIAYAPGAPIPAAPVAFDYTKRLRADAAGVVELPATFDDDPLGATYTLVQAPAQATLLGATSRGYRILQPNPGASGTDSLTWFVTTAEGSSSVATVTLEYTIDAQLVPYGCGTNPSGSLTIVSGKPAPGCTFVLGLDNPLGTQSAGAQTYLFLAFAADPNYPCGTLLPNFGMSGAGQPGELLINLLPPDPVAYQIGPSWAGPGSPAEFAVLVPNDATLYGTTVFGQGLLLDPTAAFGVKFGLSEGIEIRVGS
jgi:hypothetical protein